MRYKKLYWENQDFTVRKVRLPGRLRSNINVIGVPVAWRIQSLHKKEDQQYRSSRMPATLVADDPNIAVHMG